VIRFLADENLTGSIVAGLLRRNPSVDIVRTQDTDLAGASDRDLLQWAARQGRILLTHDVRTVTRAASRIIEAGQPLAGVLIIRDTLPVSQAIEELLLIAECSDSREWQGVVDYLPL